VHLVVFTIETYSNVPESLAYIRYTLYLIVTTQREILSHI
jgi:hypothetical protein